MKKLLILALFIVFSAGAANAQSFYDFTAEDLEGNDLTLSDLLKDGPVLMGFWATWCTPCKEELKHMEVLYEKYKDQGFTYLAINNDSQKSLSKVKAYISAKGYTFLVVLDTDQKIFEAYQGEALPYSLLFNMDGDIVAKHLGYITGDEVKIEKEVKGVLPDNSGSGNE